MRCVTCNGSLRGLQRKFCSRFCKNTDTNNRNQDYATQQRRARERKLELTKLKGEKCSRCGYAKNYAALQLHHPNPREKEFQVDSRNLSNRRWEAILKEAEKCVLLCANCHAEEHHPDCVI